MNSCCFNMGYMPEYFLAGSRNFLESVLVIWQLYGGDKTPESQYIVPRKINLLGNKTG